MAAQGVWRLRGLRRSGPVRGPRRRCVESETRTTARRLAACCHGWFATCGHCLRVGASCHGVRGERPIERCGRGRRGGVRCGGDVI